MRPTKHVIVQTLSHAKVVYVLTKGHLSRFQNMGIGSCVRCFIQFKENDIIATSTSQHYCYICAVKINLVTGKITKDLHNDEFVSEVIRHIKSLTKKLSIPKEIKEFANILITSVFEKSLYVTKNKLGLACAAISLSFEIKNQDVSINNLLPISDAVLKRNLYALQKNLESIDIYSLSQKIHGMKK